MKAKLTLLASLFLFTTSGLALAESPKIRPVPAEFKEMKNPFTSAEDLAKGESIYRKKCEECHGEKGEGDGENATIFNDGAYMKKKTDGELFYIASQGNGEGAEMEAYGPESDAGLSEQKIWQAITFIRTLAK